MSAASKLRLASSGPGGAGGLAGTRFVKRPVPGKTRASAVVVWDGGGVPAADAAGAGAGAAAAGAASVRRLGGSTLQAPSTSTSVAETRGVRYVISGSLLAAARGARGGVRAALQASWS